jgi:ATP-binding cassette, subfamily B, bacterial HlyB/CyaB
VLEAGEWFGLDPTPDPNWRAIAASDGQVLWLPWSALQGHLAQFPKLQKMLQQDADRLAKLAFFKTQTNLGRRMAIDGSATLSPQQLSQLLPSMQTVEIAAEQVLVRALWSDGHYWLRSGTIKLPNGEAPAIGDQLPAVIPPTWQAQTAVVIEQLPTAAWNALGDTVETRPATHRSADRLVPVITPPVATADASAKTSANPIAFAQPQRHLSLRRLWRRYPFIEQQSSSDCGVACLAMIAQYWGQSYPLHHLRALAKVGRSGASLRSLAAAAESIGFQASPVRASLDRLAAMKSPWVAHWEGDHYIVVYQIRGGQVLVADPAAGRRTMTRAEFIQGWTGYALLLEVNDRLKPIAGKNGRSLGQFWQLLWGYRPLLFQIVGVSLVLQLCGLFSPMFTQIILDRVVVEKSMPALHLFSIGLVIFGLWRIILGLVRSYLLDYLSNRMNLTLISGFINHTLKLPLKFFEDRSVGDIITRIQENSKIQNFLINQAVSTWLDAIMAVSYIGLMVYYNVRLALLVLALIPPIVILTLVATPFLKQISREVFKESSENTAMIVEMMSGLEAVKSAAVEREVRWRWEERFVRLLNVQFKGQKLSNGLDGVGGFINTVGSTALLWYGATLVIQGELTIGQFVAFNMLIGNVIGPVLAVIGVWDEFQEVLIAVERLNDIFEAEPETTARASFALPKLQGEVEFDKVTFRYDEAADQCILQNLSFVAKPGETLALVGRSGSGKTTLIKLLQGMYHPTQGRILVDDHDVRTVLPQSLRSQMGVVPQECFLFSGTVQDNIQLYRPEFALEQVIEAAKLAEAHSFIQAMPLAYSTKVGERGANLSGGQRQRIAIARSLIGDPKILILDEATSALDTESERRFQENLERYSRDRTTFIIAHRLSTVQRADRILVLDQGILVEQGNHEALMAQHGIYYHLAQQQLSL